MFSSALPSGCPAFRQSVSTLLSQILSAPFQDLASPIMKEKLLPKAAGAFIASRSVDVKVCSSGVESAASLISAALMKGDFGLHSWSEDPLNPKLPDDADETAVKAAVDWVFFVDSLNFSFWSDETRDKRYTVKYKNEDFVGYWSLCAAVLFQYLVIYSASMEGLGMFFELLVAIPSTAQARLPLLVRHDL